MHGAWKRETTVARIVRRVGAGLVVVLAVLSARAAVLGQTGTPPEMKVVAGSGAAGFADGVGAGGAVQQADSPGAVRPGRGARGRHLQPRDPRRLEGRARAHDRGRARSQGPCGRTRRRGALRVAARRGHAPDGRIVVAEAEGHTLRVLTPDGRRAGRLRRCARWPVRPGRSGGVDGPAAQALFNSPHAALWGADGALYVPDIGNATIRRVQERRGSRPSPARRDSSSTRWTSPG